MLCKILFFERISDYDRDMVDYKEQTRSNLYVNNPGNWVIKWHRHSLDYIAKHQTEADIN